MRKIFLGNRNKYLITKTSSSQVIHPFNDVISLSCKILLGHGRKCIVANITHMPEYIQIIMIYLHWYQNQKLFSLESISIVQDIV